MAGLPKWARVTDCAQKGGGASHGTNEGYRPPTSARSQGSVDNSTWIAHSPPPSLETQVPYRLLALPATLSSNKRPNSAITCVTLNHLVSEGYVAGGGEHAQHSPLRGKIIVHREENLTRRDARQDRYESCEARRQEFGGPAPFPGKNTPRYLLGNAPPTSADANRHSHQLFFSKKLPLPSLFLVQKGKHVEPGPPWLRPGKASTAAPRSRRSGGILLLSPSGYARV